MLRSTLHTGAVFYGENFVELVLRTARELRDGGIEWQGRTHHITNPYTKKEVTLLSASDGSETFADILLDVKAVIEDLGDD